MKCRESHLRAQRVKGGEEVLSPSRARKGQIRHFRAHEFQEFSPHEATSRPPINAFSIPRRHSNAATPKPKNSVPDQRAITRLPTPIESSRSAISARG